MHRQPVCCPPHPPPTGRKQRRALKQTRGPRGPGSPRLLRRFRPGARPGCDNSGTPAKPHSSCTNAKMFRPRSSSTLRRERPGFGFQIVQERLNDERLNGVQLAPAHVLDLLGDVWPVRGRRRSPAPRALAGAAARLAAPTTPGYRCRTDRSLPVRFPLPRFSEGAASRHPWPCGCVRSHRPGFASALRARPLSTRRVPPVGPIRPGARPA